MTIDERIRDAFAEGFARGRSRISYAHAWAHYLKVLQTQGAVPVAVFAVDPVAERGQEGPTRDE